MVETQQTFSKPEMEAMRRALKDEGHVKAQFWPKLAKRAAQLPFAADLAAFWFCLNDPATPHRVRLTLLGAIAYFVMPFDLIPDFLPLIGFTDDAAVIAAALASLKGAVTDEHRAKGRDALASLDTSQVIEAENG